VPCRSLLPYRPGTQLKISGGYPRYQTACSRQPAATWDNDMSNPRQWKSLSSIACLDLSLSLSLSVHSLSMLAMPFACLPLPCDRALACQSGTLTHSILSWPEMDATGTHSDVKRPSDYFHPLCRIRHPGPSNNWLAGSLFSAPNPSPCHGPVWHQAPPLFRDVLYYSSPT